MRTGITLLVLGQLLLGCGSGPCLQRGGTYARKLTARSGDCGEFQETIFSAMGQQTMPTAPCTGTITYSPDSCEVTHDQRCPLEAPARGQVEVRGVVHWDAFGSNGNGVFEYRVNSPDPAQQCQGTYDAEYTRLGAPALDAGI